MVAEPFGASVYVAALDRLLTSACPVERLAARCFMLSFASDYRTPGVRRPVYGHSGLRALIVDAIDHRLHHGPPR